MTTALVLFAALVLGVLGAWGTARLLGLLRLSPAERFALALALFPATLGLAAFGGLLAGQPGPRWPLVACLLLVALGGMTLVMRRRTAPGRRTSRLPVAGTGAGGQKTAPGQGMSGPVVVGTALFGAGAFGTMLLTPLSAGALRIGDWVAHWFLVLVYLGERLPDLRTFTNRVGNFGVISRPPLYNLEGGLLVGALDTPFWPFQLLTPLLALAVAAAGVLWAQALGGRRVAWVTAGLIGLAPFLIQNSTYPWSKMVAAGQVLLFLYLIRVALLSRERARCRQAFVLAAVCAGLGYLAHQTTLFYVLPAVAWLAVRRPRPLFRRPSSWSLTTWTLGGVAGVLVVAPWQGWVLLTYGLSEVLASNPASFGVDVSDSFADWLAKGGVAALGTLVPLPALGTVFEGEWPSVDQVLRFQLAVLTGALGFACCWLLLRAAGRGHIRGSLRRPPLLALVLLAGFLGQVMLQPNWHDTGDAAESMTPIVVLGLVYAAREALRLGRSGRLLFVGVVLAESLFYLGLWVSWAFSSTWTRDPNATLGMRYELLHVRHVWDPAVQVGAVLVAAGLLGCLFVLWRALSQPSPGAAAGGVGDTAAHGPAATSEPAADRQERQPV